MRAARRAFAAALLLAAAATSALPFTLAGSRRPARPRARRVAAAAGQDDVGADLLAGNRLLHAMVRVTDMGAAVDFWRGRGAQVISGGGKVGKGATFVGFGEYRDTEHFALELSPVAADRTLGNSAVDYVGLSGLRPPASAGAGAGDDEDEDEAARFSRFMAAVTAAAAPARDPSGLLEVRSVPAAPGDPFAHLCLRARSREDLEASTAFYCDALRMRQVGMASDQERTFRYAPLDGGAMAGVPTTLIFRLGAEEAAGGVAGESEEPLEVFDHLAICCRDVDAAFEHIRGQGIAPIILEPRDMFGTRIMGLEDPNGYKVYLVGEEGFRAAAQ